MEFKKPEYQIFSYQHCSCTATFKTDIERGVCSYCHKAIKQKDTTDVDGQIS